MATLNPVITHHEDNALNVSICFKGLSLPNKSIQDLVEGKNGILNVKDNLKESS